MSSSVDRFIAWRYLRSPRQEGLVAVIAWFSFLGIVLGVATLIIVMSVMNGFRSELMNRILGFNGHLTVYTQSGPPLDLEKLRKIPHVASVTPLLEKQGLCLTTYGAAGCIIRGMSLEDLKSRSLIANNLLDGSLASFTQSNGVIMGYKLARKLGIKVGDTFRIMAAEGRPTAFGMLPHSRHFQVSGIFDSGMHEYDSAFLFMPLTTAKVFFETPEIRIFEMFMQDPDRLDELKKRLAGPGIGLHDWRQSNSHFFKAIQVQSNVMFFILNLIVLVAVFNIVSCLVMLVKDKTKDIAVLRTLGATRGMVMRIFFFTGAFIGISGTSIGALLGLGFAHYIDDIRRGLEKLAGVDLFQAEIYFLSTLPSKVDFREVGSVLFLSLLFSFLATLYPAWKASRLNPVDGLRYE